MATTTPPRHPITKKRLIGALAVLVALSGLSKACGLDEGQEVVSQATPTAQVAITSTPSPSVSPTPSPSPSPTPAELPAEPAQAAPAGEASEGQDALTVLAAIPVKGRAPKTGYNRDQFGPAWKDVDRNGCDTRNDILSRDLTDVSYKPGTHNCVVLTGVLTDPYTATTISFQRGQDTSTAVQIDHVVALSDAWQKGAQNISEDQRTQLANDPYNLLAVDGPTNQKKSDGDAATWLPPNKDFRCEYVARQIGVKHKYGLWVTQAEADAMRRVLDTCPGQTVPASAGVSHAAAPADSQPAPPAPAPAPAAPAGDSAGVSYPNCKAARAAGAAPLYAGQPGYSRKLDRDGDGIACE